MREDSTRVLIADDDRVTAAILGKTLRRWGLEVVEANNGLDAWDLLQAPDRPALAIVDWMMPGLDGLELCRRIRQQESLAALHLILLTARDDRGDIIAGLDAGADDYIIKPFDLEELRARVRAGLRIVSLQQRLAQQVRELQSARDELARLAGTDMLTELHSRRRWFELAASEFARCQRYRRPFSVLTADLDYFKQVNDRYGHAAGDAVLKAFAQVLRLQCRGTDAPGRLGGEEFAILLPETSTRVASDVAQRIVNACRALTIETAAGAVQITCSMGVASVVLPGDTIDLLLQRADEALYRAKHNGRDRLEVEQIAPATATIRAAS